MNEGFFLFLAKEDGSCLFDTYFVQKVIWNLNWNALSFDSLVHRDDRQYVFPQFTIILRLQNKSLSSSHFS